MFSWLSLFQNQPKVDKNRLIPRKVVGEVLPPVKVYNPNPSADKKKRKRIVFETYDYESDTWKRVERVFGRDGEEDIISEIPLIDEKIHYREGFDAFEESQFMNLGWEEIKKLCPYTIFDNDTLSVKTLEWWRGWYSAAKLNWYFKSDPKDHERKSSVEDR